MVMAHPQKNCFFLTFKIWKWQLSLIWALQQVLPMESRVFLAHLVVFRGMLLFSAAQVWLCPFSSWVNCPFPYGKAGGTVWNRISNSLAFLWVKV